MPKYAKGSPEMKQHMAKLRAMKGKMRGKGSAGENYYHPSAHDLLPASQQGGMLGLFKSKKDAAKEAAKQEKISIQNEGVASAAERYNEMVRRELEEKEERMRKIKENNEKETRELRKKWDDEDLRKAQTKMETGKSKSISTPINKGMGIVHVIHHHHLHGEGWTDDARNFFSGVGNQIENGFHDTIAQPIQQVVAPVKNTLNTLQDTLVNKIGKGYIAKKKGGLATDLIQYGVPALGSAVGSTLGESAGLLTGNPLLGFAGGVAGGAMGSKAGNMLANKIRNDTGTGMRRKKT
jgi:hypothetical protein